jgi:hypothetical protein
MFVIENLSWGDFRVSLQGLAVLVSLDADEHGATYNCFYPPEYEKYMTMHRTKEIAIEVAKEWLGENVKKI